MLRKISKFSIVEIMLVSMATLFSLSGLCFGAEKQKENFLIQSYSHYDYNTPNDEQSLYKTSECIIRNKGNEPIEVILEWKDTKGGSFERTVTISKLEETPEGDMTGGIFSTASLDKDFPRVTQENIDFIKAPGTLEGTCFSLYIYTEKEDDKPLIECSLIDTTYPIVINEEQDEMEGEVGLEETQAEVTDGFNEPPVVVIEGIAPNPCVVGEAVTFKVSVSDSNGDIKSLTLDFGDGNIVGGEDYLNYQNYTHNYDAPGTYTVKLKAVDKSGEEDQEVTTITVNANMQASDQPPQVTITSTQDNIITSDVITVKELPPPTNHPPTLKIKDISGNIVQTSVTVDLNSTIELVLEGSDPDGDKLTYFMSGDYEGGLLEGNHFTYKTPSIEGNRPFVFGVRDSKGAASELITIIVYYKAGLPDLIVDNIVLSSDSRVITPIGTEGKYEVVGGKSFKVEATIKNIGNYNSEPAKAGLYVTRHEGNQVYPDFQEKTCSIPSLAPGETYKCEISLTLDPWASYFSLQVIADCENINIESNKYNNNSEEINVTVSHPFIDLIIDNIVLSSDSRVITPTGTGDYYDVVAGEGLKVEATIKNIGNYNSEPGKAVMSWLRMAGWGPHYFDFGYSTPRIPSLAPGETYKCEIVLKPASDALDGIFPKGYLLNVIIYNGDVEDSWNNKSKDIHVQVIKPTALPDLTITSLTAPEFIRFGNDIPVTIVYSNIGQAAAAACYKVSLQVRDVEGAVVYEDNFFPLAALDAGKNTTFDMNIPRYKLEVGTYTITAEICILGPYLNGTIIEDNKENNAMSTQIKVQPKKPKIIKDLETGEDIYRLF